MAYAAAVCVLATAFLAAAATLETGVENAKAIHLPLVRSSRPSWKRDGQTGLGDVLDVTYTASVKVGETQTPLILDTGSSDLWLISDACGDSCLHFGVPLYHQNALTPAGHDAQLLYGDSRTGTQAFGPIGTDTVGVAGISVPNQYFAAISDTNTTVLESGSAGILGLGFPSVSVIWRELLAGSGNVAGAPFNRNFDENSDLDPRQGNITPSTSAVDTFTTLGPFFTRLVTLDLLSRPLVATTLQRDTVSLGGNAGILSLGALPFDLKDDDLTWVPVRGYTAFEGGLPAPPDAPNEVYPMVWEIPLDDVYFDGIKLPRSTFLPSSVSLSALVDTGNSLVRGPQDVVEHINTLLGDTFDCAVPHNLSFEIGGVQFPVDPRDFAHPAPVIPGMGYPDELARCTPALAATDPPSAGGFLYSWSLGDPFLKSALVAFYYGNMTHPSRDPARIGFMSTVPSDANLALEKAVASAVYDGGVFPSTSESAPYATALEMHPMDTVPTAMPEGWARASSRAVSLSSPALDSGESCWTISLMVVVLIGLTGFL